MHTEGEHRDCSGQQRDRDRQEDRTSIPLPVDIPARASTSSIVPDTATPTPASVTNDVSATPAASPARSGRTTAWVATVVNAYTRPMVNPHAVSAIT